MTKGYRPVYAIAADIEANWIKPSEHALPYIKAMKKMYSGLGYYVTEDATAVLYGFIANSKTWRGATARRVKEEIKSMLPLPNSRELR